MSRLDEIEKRIDARMDEINRRIAQREHDVDGKVGSSTHMPPVAEAPSRMAENIWRVTGRELSAAPTVGPQSIFPEVSGDAWTFTPQVVKMLMEVVCSSPSVVSNSQYAALVPRLQLKFIETSMARPEELGGFLDQSQINAYARMDPLEGFPTICLLSGAVRYAALMTAAYVGWKMAEDDPAWGRQAGIVPFQRVVVAMVEHFQRNGGRLTSELAATFANKYNLNGALSVEEWREGALRLAYGTIICILAHEFGHLALGHCCAVAENKDKDIRDEITRHQERQADSFASSVVSASEYKEVLGLGTIIWELAFAVTELSSGADEGDHPLSIERLLNFIRDNPSTAEAIGWNEILALLKTIGIDLSMSSGSEPAMI